MEASSLTESSSSAWVLLCIFRFDASYARVAQFPAKMRPEWSAVTESGRYHPYARATHGLDSPQAGSSGRHRTRLDDVGGDVDGRAHRNCFDRGWVRFENDGLRQRTADGGGPRPGILAR